LDISEDVVDDSFLAENLGMLKESINKLDRFIADILNYSRNAREEVKVEEIDFNKMVGEILNNLRYMNRSSNHVKLNIDLNTEMPLVCDKHRLYIILNNLISNSLRYCNPKAVAPYINLTLNTNISQTYLVIEDNGIGIGQEHLSKVFNMFYRASGMSEGSGLGLYIVKQTVEKLKGQIEISSEQGLGTTFRITLPTYVKQDNLNKMKVEDLCTIE